MVFCYLKIWRQQRRCLKDQDTGIKQNNPLSEAKTNVRVWVIAYLVNQKAHSHPIVQGRLSLMTKRIKRCGCFVLFCTRLRAGHLPVGFPYCALCVYLWFSNYGNKYKKTHLDIHQTQKVLWGCPNPEGDTGEGSLKGSGSFIGAPDWESVVAFQRLSW